MRIALYLGSFNPFHNGHLEVVKSALRDFKMDKVVIVPSVQNPWKKDKPLGVYNRIDIIEKSILTSAICYWHKIFIDSIEVSLIPPYYSYATLHALKNKYCNDKVFVLCGEDTIEKIPEWMHGEQIIKDYDFLIVDRPRRGQYAISSTYIRECVKLDKPINGMVSNNVINLIKNYYK